MEGSNFVTPPEWGGPALQANLAVDPYTNPGDPQCILSQKNCLPVTPFVQIPCPRVQVRMTPLGGVPPSRSGWRRARQKKGVTPGVSHTLNSPTGDPFVKAQFFSGSEEGSDSNSSSISSLTPAQGIFSAKVGDNFPVSGVDTINSLLVPPPLNSLVLNSSDLTNTNDPRVLQEPAASPLPPEVVVVMAYFVLNLHVVYSDSTHICDSCEKSQGLDPSGTTPPYPDLSMNKSMPTGGGKYAPTAAVDTQVDLSSDLLQFCEGGKINLHVVSSIPEGGRPPFQPILIKQKSQP